MNDRPTPETNLEEMLQTQRYGVYMVKSDFARRLERERDEALRLLEKWEQVTIGGGMSVLELTKQCEKLAEAAKLIADEYEDRRCQYGGDYLWTKHEQTEAIENALAIINEHHHEQPNNTDTGD